MTNEERYGFCVAATFYALARFLAVDRNQLRLPFELIHSIVDPLQIKSHNWCQLVRKCWLVQAMSVQNQISRGDKTIKVGGCPFIAQVGSIKNILEIVFFNFHDKRLQHVNLTVENIFFIFYFSTKVHYLDNVQFGIQWLPGDVYPRGCLYTKEVVDKLTLMDTKTNDMTNKLQYGNHEVLVPLP
jgi:hypothetical protein